MKKFVFPNVGCTPEFKTISSIRNAGFPCSKRDTVLRKIDIFSYDNHQIYPSLFSSMAEASVHSLLDTAIFAILYNHKTQLLVTCMNAVSLSVMLDNCCGKWMEFDKHLSFKSIF